MEPFGLQTEFLVNFVGRSWWGMRMWPFGNSRRGDYLSQVESKEYKALGKELQQIREEMARNGEGGRLSCEDL